MRPAWPLALLLFLSACTSDRLALAPPPGVDFTGRWKLNEADSDDPQRLVMSQLGGAPGAQGSQNGQGGGQGGQGGGQGGRGGRGGRGGGPGGGMGGMGGGGPAGPSVPAVGALAAGLRWPGKEVEIKQVGGMVAMTSGKDSRVFQPVDDVHHHPRKKPPPDQDQGPRNRDMPSREHGDGPPPMCGWDGRSLVVQGGDPDDDHPPFEQRYSLSEDGKRLIEVVGFKGGRSGGFTMSRVWDRVP